MNKAGIRVIVTSSTLTDGEWSLAWDHSYLFVPRSLASRLSGPGGEFKEIIVVAKDTTERRRTEQALRQSNDDLVHRRVQA